MQYDVNALLSAQKTGAGVLYNYEYHIVNYVLAFNNCINFYLYFISGSSWRRAFIVYVKEKMCGVCRRCVG